MRSRWAGLYVSLGPIFLAGAIGVIAVFAVSEQFWIALAAAICWLVIVLWFVFPRRDDEVREVRTKSRDPFDLR